ncbi:H-NS family nucleoid-associated regulatory protein [Cupriavidus sp. a3]|uniref:H-NS family nucleoid-associated regulatory protein n=1 Tax=Cupriavidus sp. a3 TaxID=3242158 RepID=UPI003D9C6213
MDPHTGKTWSGRGRRPGWLRGNESRYHVTGFWGNPSSSAPFCHPRASSLYLGSGRRRTA